MHQGIWNSTQKGIWRSGKDNDPESAPQSLRSDGSHLAAGTGAEAHDDRSDGSHLAAGSGADAHDDAEAFVAFIWYNVGIQNTEVNGPNWFAKCDRLAADIRKAFTCDENAAQALFISEFGNMFDLIEKEIAQRQRDAVSRSGGGVPQLAFAKNTKELFDLILLELGLQHLTVYSHPPYVAIVDESCWEVEMCEKLFGICSFSTMCVQHLLLRHVESSTRARVFNAHIPSSRGTPERKKDIIRKMCVIATDETNSAVKQRVVTAAWIIGGDCNVDVGLMSSECSSFVEPNVRCISKSGWPCDDEAQKADFALSQGIEIAQVVSWIGIHSKPCVTDVHDAVVVMGCVKGLPSPLRNPPCRWKKPGIEFFAASDGGASSLSQVAEYNADRAQAVAIYARKAVNQASTALELPSSKGPFDALCGDATMSSSTSNSGILQSAECAGGACSVEAEPEVFKFGTVPIQRDGTDTTHIAAGAAATTQIIEDEHVDADTSPDAVEIIDADTSGILQSAECAGGACSVEAEPEVFKFGTVPIQRDGTDTTHIAAGAAATTQTIEDDHVDADASPDAVEIIDADTHPPSPTRFADAEEILNCISQEALTDASHDAPTQQPQPATQHAAQDILCTLFTSKGGTAIRSLEEVLQRMSEPIRRRKEVVSSITQGTAAYTVEECVQWFRHHPLGEREMDAAVERWKSEFEANDMRQHSIEKVQEWRKENTRNSKKSARDLVRGCWRQHVETTCGSFQLTMLFLTYPAATVKTLLQAHATYMSSPEHEKEVQRASKLDKTNEAAVAEEERQVQLKVQLSRDRSNRRRALALHRKITAGEIDAPFPSVAPFYYSWKSGLLDKRIDEASAKHGYGRTTSGHMHAPRVKNFVEQLGGSLTQSL